MAHNIYFLDLSTSILPPAADRGGGIGPRLRERERDRERDGLRESFLVRRTGEREYDLERERDREIERE